MAESRASLLVESALAGCLKASPLATRISWAGTSDTDVRWKRRRVLSSLLAFLRRWTRMSDTRVGIEVTAEGEHRYSPLLTVYTDGLSLSEWLVAGGIPF